MHRLEINDPRINATPEDANNCPHSQNCENDQSSCTCLPKCREHVLSLLEVTTTDDIFGFAGKELDRICEEFKIPIKNGSSLPEVSTTDPILSDLKNGVDDLRKALEKYEKKLRASMN